MLTLAQTLPGVGIATSLFCALKKLTSPKKMESIPDPSPQQYSLADPPTTYPCKLLECALRYCPILVILTSPVNSRMSNSGIGFIASDSGESITVWGHSTFLYEYEEEYERSRKILRKDKVFVTIKKKKYEGKVVHVGFNLDLLVLTINISIIPSLGAPSKRASAVESLRMVHCLDYIPYIGTFFPKVYQLRNPEDVCCARGAHVDWHVSDTPAVVLQNGLIFGIKTGQCKFNEDLEDVVMLHEMFEALGKYTFVDSHPHSDSIGDETDTGSSSLLSPPLDLQPGFDNLRIETASIRPQQHFPTYRPITRTPRQECSLDACAQMYCPNLVTISCYLNSVRETTGLGFIVFDTGKSITVWGSSLFLYEYEETNDTGHKIRRKGKVLVQIYGEQHEGEVVHIDFNLDVLIVTVKTSILCGSSAVLPRLLDVVSLPDCKVHCLIYIPFMGRFYPEVYELSNTKETRCGRSVHVVFSGSNFSGVVLQNGCILGIKMTKCKFNEKLADVVLLHEMFEALSTIPSVVIHPCSDNASTSLSPLLNLQPSFDNLRMNTAPMLLPCQEQGQLEGSASEIVELVA